MEEKRICPECGKEYSSRPALSRKDNKTMICPKCGMMEALDTVRNFYAPGMTDQQWKRYKEEYMLTDVTLDQTNNAAEVYSEVASEVQSTFSNPIAA